MEYSWIVWGVQRKRKSLGSVPVTTQSVGSHWYCLRHCQTVNPEVSEEFWPKICTSLDKSPCPLSKLRTSHRGWMGGGWLPSLPWSKRLWECQSKWTRKNMCIYIYMYLNIIWYEYCIISVAADWCTQNSSFWSLLFDLKQSRSTWLNVSCE